MKEKQQRNACAIKTSIGGQALMEGIMMRGPQKAAMAVRNPEGVMVLEEVPMKAKKRPKICKLPIIRGVFGFIDAMSMGYKCLMRSAEIAGLEDLVEEKPKKKKKNEAEETEAAPVSAEVTEETAQTAEKSEAASEVTESPEKKDASEEKIPAWMMTLMMAVTVILAVALAVGLFFYVPTLVYDLLASHVGFLRGENAVLNSLWKSVFEGVFKIVLIVGYMAAVSLMKDIRRTFMYHGAEHKTIFCYEAGLELTVENVRRQRRFHPRCGTSFLILMMLVGIFVSFFIDPISIAVSGSILPWFWRVPLRILLFPISMGLGYELIKLAGKHDNLLTRIISAPGMWLQHITVFEPTDDMIECAIAAVKEVIPQDGSDRI